MIYNLNNEYERKKFSDNVKLFLDKSDVVEMKRKTTQRSLSQNSYLHVLLGFFASEFGYTKEEVKYRFFKLHCNRDIFERQRVNRRGQTVTYIRSSKELDKAEMSTAIERFRNYSSAECGFYLPEPDEGNIILFAQQQIELCKNYI